MKWIVIVPVALAVAAIAGVVYVRSADHDPARWHVDPATVTETDGSNLYLGTQTFAAPRELVTSTLSDALGGEVLAGSFAEGWVTVVVRTALVGYPDYVSVRIADADDGVRVMLYSRSRFGKSDLGANQKRVQRVFAEMSDALAGRS